MPNFSQLLSDLREEADNLRQWGATAQADAAFHIIGRIEAWARERELEALTLEEAAKESGYTYSGLQKMMARGELTNAGTKHRPRLIRGELPKKGGKREGSRSLAEDILFRRTA
jgi:hypothetical protein